MRIRTHIKHGYKKIKDNVYWNMFFTFFIPLIALTIIMLFSSIQGLRTNSWVGVDGTYFVDAKASKSVSVRGVGNGRFGEGTYGYSFSASYTAEAYYYKVKGKYYTNDVVSYKGFERSMHRVFNCSNKIRVFYNPNNPQSSVLERGIDIASFYEPPFGLIAFVFAGFGGLIMLARFVFK